MDNVKYLCNGSPIFKVDDEVFKAKPGFNEMPIKFTKDPYYDMCKNGGIIKDFVSNISDKQQEEFDKQIQTERERADALQKELDELKAANAGKEGTDTGKDKKQK